MPYPSRLVPDNTKDQTITSLEKSHILCRWVDPSLVLKDANGDLTAEAIEESQLPSYSTNKIPPSIPEDIHLEFLNKFYDEEWRDGTPVSAPSNSDYRNDVGNFFLFRIGDIDRFGDTYPFPPNPGASHNQRFKVIVLHKPLNGNISHCEFAIKHFSYDGTSEVAGGPSKKSATMKKVIIAEIRRRLIKIAKFNLSQLPPPQSSTEEKKPKPKPYLRVRFKGNECLMFSYQKGDSTEMMVWKETQDGSLDLNFLPFIIRSNGLLKLLIEEGLLEILP